MNNLSKRINVIGLLLFLCLPVIVSGCLDAGEQMINPSPKATPPPPDSTSAPPSADSTPVPTFTATQSSTQSSLGIATATPTADLPIAPVMGARAPDFTLTDLNGDEMSLSNLRGQPLLLNFWATW